MPCAKNQAPRPQTVSIKSKQQQQKGKKEGRKEREKKGKEQKKKLKYAKEFRGSFFFSVCQDETICRTHHSNVFTALYSKIDHFI